MYKYGRKFTKLRLNLLDACNMRCLYCMPENQSFTSLDKTLSAAEIYSITSNLVSAGIKEIRITGGEPLLHPEFKQIVKALSELELEKLSLTTNAVKLDQYLSFLKQIGRLEVSCLMFPNFCDFLSMVLLSMAEKGLLLLPI